MSGPTAAATGWEALRDALHFRGVRSREDFGRADPRHGVPDASMGRSFQRQDPRKDPQPSITIDARVSGLESLFVRLTLAEGHRGQVPFPAQGGQQGHWTEPTTQDCTPRSSRRPHPMLDQFPESSWSVLEYGRTIVEVVLFAALLAAVSAGQQAQGDQGRFVQAV